jgi:hypothetical protein
LFLLGLGLTFNMGRDITLLVLFPFVFGYIGIRIAERWGDARPPMPRGASRAQARRAAAP